MTGDKIVWTLTDEAPMLATYSLLPILEKYLKEADISVELRDISLAGRIVANFPERLSDEQKIEDHLALLGALACKPECNLIKLPNISASTPQLQAAIAELKTRGYDLPDYPSSPRSDAEKAIKARYAKVLGSAVNPVLREGNSDRRAASSVKAFGQKHPHGMMKPWPKTSKCKVASMPAGDNLGSEKSVTMPKADKLTLEFVGKDGSTKVLKEFAVQEGEVVDCSALHVETLHTFVKETVKEAKREGVLLSLHLKATMMKVSDPIVFGHVVTSYFADVFAKHAATFKELGVNPNYGVSTLLKAVREMDDKAKAAEIEQDINACYDAQCGLAMVDSSKGITNLHAPNNVIIDASMPNVVRDGGKMWNKDDQLQDTICMIPDRSYAGIYQATIEDCQEHGQLDPATMGSCANVGLMAQKAEEYGSHDKTFEMEAEGAVLVKDSSGAVLMEQAVEVGDIFRACQTKDVAVHDWVKLAVNRARESGEPAIFWLDDRRAHDREIAAKVNKYLPEFNTEGLSIQTMEPVAAQKASLALVRAGKNVISCTGNVLRDYLTDLYPIIELGTSARMLSIVPLINGGGLFETGAGGSAPKHIEQFVEEGHLRWDSLGEYCALVPSLEMAAARGNAKAAVMAAALDAGIMKYLENRKLPGRKVKQLDNRGAAFWLALYWAESLANLATDTNMKLKFFELAQKLQANAEKIDKELIECQGTPVDIGGYYYPCQAKLRTAMCPSQTLNDILATF
uniref:Isocitrate dehydrogenase (NADP(+)) n=1 Tax=Pyramimonas obovata TaxID=1411642 RepID=A0A7S0R4F7_9CHLO|mmetsp:Transcript_25363/g.55145  ORF Transcript_25363/g.55145 Transcript_25363/m.55145 type:complete len:741 (+) Transcript_25363:105-2327(+)|eukprot:CAMPEP_0118924216 /NCGR_PEP_ID=MMETSP1169-20130426/2451_1 /TAXON_ID=36882 /ORGANISM="Pyramimonas obovata, Strain CCMP722" /LENGTH=740 /DNA_ID=CAMNT_0006865307 /DNA_START=99 /DNA_END=2321 /DNA_ORIENTATION=+